jgi:hypothetical protein
MSIPLSTTTITISRKRDDDDPYDTPTVRPVANGIRAVIGSPSGRDRVIGGDQSAIVAKLDCDVCDLRHYDYVTDDRTTVEYAVVWVTERQGLGLDHLEAGLTAVTGASNG